jgi:hypothetical protein
MAENVLLKVFRVKGKAQLIEEKEEKKGVLEYVKLSLLP